MRMNLAQLSLCDLWRVNFFVHFCIKISFIYIPSCTLPHSFNWIWSWVSCERRTRLQSNHSGSSLRSDSSRLNQLSELVGQPVVAIAQALKEVNLSKMGVWSSLGRGVLFSLDKGGTVNEEAQKNCSPRSPLVISPFRFLVVWKWEGRKWKWSTLLLGKYPLL